MLYDILSHLQLREQLRHPCRLCVGRIVGVKSYTCNTCTDGPMTIQWPWDPRDSRSVLGDGTNSPTGTDNSGMAPGAHLFMQAVLAVGGTCNGSSTLCDPPHTMPSSQRLTMRVQESTRILGALARARALIAPRSGSSSGSCLAYYSSASYEIDAEANSLYLT